ncbi:RNA methyltransferase [Pseudomaricurvus alkylphenolicus]|uniref:TrmH family RNA methyltransferase n=1 Tax=Pseudomaricurvus alkylphenolicus TaxID=1306991 RepID=UPI001421A808|nr:RNA methyltransferase [Pseudomaricurvus alkylphenolicus]NIB41315.1 RNA methyltransferase [Pseudomaricurvus alkylphenolicus]
MNKGKTEPDSPLRDSDDYQRKKAFFDQLLTVYGRKPVLEALQDSSTRVFRLHLADSNRPASILDDIRQLAETKGAEVVFHDRQSLSRISRNSKQDQGVAVDLVCSGYQDHGAFLDQIEQNEAPFMDVIALDRITNPQNLGMIIRSVCAGGARALLLPEKGCARLDALVIKASAGTLFRAPILRCKSLPQALQAFRQQGFDIYGLSSHADATLSEVGTMGKNVFVLGNETEGVSREVSNLCNRLVSIPMNNGVESLNVAVTASLLSYRSMLGQS